MALVAFLRGINVGGHRRFRPAILASQLRHLGATNVGTAGTFVFWQPVTHAALRAELTRRLPFDAEIVIIPGPKVVQLVSRHFFTAHPERRDIVRFVSVLSRRPRSTPALPMQLPARGAWLVRVLARDDRFLIGLYRRRMTVIGYLGALDRIFGVAVTTRSWSTMAAVARLLERGGTS